MPGSGSGSGADAVATENGDNIVVFNADISGAAADGLDFKATRVAIANVIVHDVSRNGIKLWGGGDVINALVYNTGADSSIVFDPREDARARYRLLNTIVAYHARDTEAYAGGVGYDHPTWVGQMQVVNTIFYQNTGPLWVSPAYSLDVRNSIFVSAHGGVITWRDITVGEGYEPFTALEQAGGGCCNPGLLDPKFVDPDRGDFHLATGSPALDSGTVEVEAFPSFDLFGNPRVAGAGVDLGPIESTTTSPAPPTAPAGETPAPSAAPAVPTQPLPEPTALPTPMAQQQSGAFRWVALGDSLTEGDGKSDEERRYTNLLLARLKTVRPQADLHNLGKSGWTLEQMIEGQLPTALGENPDLVSIWIGANDVIYFNPGDDMSASAASFERQLDAAVSQILKRTHARVILANLHDISLIPASRDWSEAERAARRQMSLALNQAIANIVQRHADRASLVDTFNLAELRETSCYADDYHPSDDCEPRIAEAWWRVIEAALR